MKRSLEVTGLAQETDFSSDTGAVQHLLVFNKGELRVAISDACARQVVEYMYGRTEPSDEQPTPTHERQEVLDEEDHEDDEEEEGVDSI
jgi:hypothetical protein